MSAQDEVSVVVKCLKFGAAGYLVKPLPKIEILNLWRRRRKVFSSPLCVRGQDDERLCESRARFIES
ncbi:timing of cab expression 1/PRR response regulator 1, putative [Medicago truncatula]|uniref:Timing of cab expression 1/PRR response regulator 1, putative n=1 Tax=Medicago truncatula TaxID=3880 RepID=A0A072V5J9_MEDTR|nr:timing of cab expression 1/PRR response regulator 1, putative [Medicago truncatula]